MKPHTPCYQWVYALKLTKLMNRELMREKNNISVKCKLGKGADFQGRSFLIRIFLCKWCQKNHSGTLRNHMGSNHGTKLHDAHLQASKKLRMTLHSFVFQSILSIRIWPSRHRSVYTLIAVSLSLSLCSGLLHWLQHESRHQITV